MNLNARRICHERKRRAWTQAQLAGAAGLGLRTIQRVENTGVASFESVQAIAAALSLTVAELRVEGDFGGVRRAPGTGRCIERDGADPAGGQRRAWLSSLPLRLLIAALSGAATGLYVDQLLNDWPLSAVETFAFYAVPGLLFAATVLCPYLELGRGFARRAIGLTVASSLSFCGAFVVAGEAPGWFGTSAVLPTLPAYLVASLVGAAVIFVATRWLIPQVASATYWLLGAVASALGGVGMHVSFNLLGGDLPAALAGFAAWHLLMCLAIHFGRPAHSVGRRVSTALVSLGRALPGGEFWRSALGAAAALRDVRYRDRIARVCGHANRAG